jgi:aryl-alcohol dehydrogenase-like predicted oxidoreductase
VSIERAELRPGYTISRLIKGGWQLAGGHGAIDRDAALDDMDAYVAAGITTFDCADIYTGVEELIGEFRRRTLQRRGAEALSALKVHTKFVPDLTLLREIDRAQVRRIIDRSLQRLGVERIDLVQFHWWNYDIPRYVEVALWLKGLQDEGKIDLIGGTNFDAARTLELIDAGVPLRTMQVQYSVLDRRPSRRLAEICAQHDIRLLCYGTVAGGLLSERWLGAPEPAASLANRSLIKYKLIIDDFCGWRGFQDILATLAGVGMRHGQSIASVATRWVLEQPHVTATIVGVRNRAHLEQHRSLFDFTLTARDHAEIGTILARTQCIGEVYALERDRTGPHGRIMKYDLGDK